MSRSKIEKFVHQVSSINLDHVGFKFSNIGKEWAGYKNYITLIHFESPFRKMKLYFQFCAYVENEKDKVETATGFSLKPVVSKIDKYEMDLAVYCRKYSLPLAQLNNSEVVGNEAHIDNYLREFDVASRTYLYDFLVGANYEATPDPRDL